MTTLSPPLIPGGSALYPPSAGLVLSPPLLDNAAGVIAPNVREKRKATWRVRVRPTRSVLDLYKGKRFVVEARHPSGRAITKGKEATRRRAFIKARAVVQPQTSPTAAAGAAYIEAALPPDIWRDLGYMNFLY